MQNELLFNSLKTFKQFNNELIIIKVSYKMFSSAQQFGDLHVNTFY